MELDEITVDWIGTKFMLADGLTKVLPGPALSDMRDKLHLVDVGPAPREPCGGVMTKCQGTHACVAAVR